MLYIDIIADWGCMITLEPTCKVHCYKVFPHVRSVFGCNPDIRSARLNGQFALDKTWNLQAGSGVFSSDINFGTIARFISFSRTACLAKVNAPSGSHELQSVELIEVPPSALCGSCEMSALFV